MIDEELKALGEVSLKNAFYEDYSALVRKYVAIAEGLCEGWEFEELLADVGIYSRNLEADTGDVYINLYGNLQGSSFSTCGYESIMEAFEDDRATEIVLQGKKIFRRDEAGEWFYCGDEA